MHFKNAEKDMLEYYKLKPNYKVKEKDNIMTICNSDVSIMVNVDLNKANKWKFDKKMEAITCELDNEGGETLVLWFDKTMDLQELITGKASKKQKLNFSGVQL